MIDLIHDCINLCDKQRLYIGERIGTMLQEVVMDSSKTTHPLHKANIDKKEALLLKLIETYEYNHSAKDDIICRNAGAYAWAKAGRNSDVIRHITKKYSPIP